MPPKAKYVNPDSVQTIVVVTLLPRRTGPVIWIWNDCAFDAPEEKLPLEPLPVATVRPDEQLESEHATKANVVFAGARLQLTETLPVPRRSSFAVYDEVRWVAERVPVPVWTFPRTPTISPAIKISRPIPIQTLCIARARVSTRICLALEGRARGPDGRPRSPTIRGAPGVPFPPA